MPIPKSICCIVAFIATCFATICSAQSESRFSDFVKHIPQSNSEVLAVTNLPDHVESIIRNEFVWKALNDFGDSMGTGGLFDREEALDWMAENRAYFPHTIAASSSDDLYPAVVNIFEFFLRMNLVVTSSFADEVVDEEFQLAEKETQDILQGFKLPNITVCIAWEDQATAAELFTTFKQQASVIGLLTELDFDEKEKSFLVSGLLADVIPQDSTELWFEMMGFANKDRELSNAILDFEVFFRAEQIENGMVISLGTDASKRPRATIDDFPGVRDGKAEIAYGQWNGAPLLNAVDQLEKDVTRWSETEMGKFFIENDVEDIWGTFDTLIGQFRLVSKNGKLRAFVQENQVIATIDEQVEDQPTGLAIAQVLKMVPENVEGYAMSATQSLADFSFGWMQQMEDRMAVNSLKSDLSGDFEQTNLFDSIIYGYHEHFGKMRAFIRDELREIPATPFAMVMDTTGSVEVEFDEIKLGLLNEPILMNADRLVRMACISETEQADELEAAMIETYRLFVNGIYSAANERNAPTPNLIKELDLGSGVVAKEFSFEWMEESDLGTLVFKGDFQPHVFRKDNIVVFSTSSELSKELLNNSTPLALAEKDNQTIVNCGRLQGKSIGNMYRTMFQIVFEFMALDDPGIAGVGDSVTEMFSGLFELMNVCDWKTTQQDKLRTTRYLFDFKN